MKRIASLLIAATIGALAFAQSNNALYQPTRNLKDQSISVRSWGSGVMSETDEIAYEGVFSLRVSTRNYFAGGLISLGNPVDLKAQFDDKNNLLRFAIRLADLNTTLGGGGPTLGGGGAKTGGPVGAGAGGPAGGGDGERGGSSIGLGGGAGQGGAAQGGAKAGDIDPLRNLRLIFTTTDGKRSEAYIPIGTSRPDAKGWITAAVPLQAIKGLAKTNKAISEIGIAGDSISTFYIGDIRIVNDSTPINGEASVNDLNLALNDEVELRGRGFGGSSILKYTWDFDDADGIQEEAEGQVIKRKFRKPGNYVCTLTISDTYGLKTPYMTKFKVKVNP